jgi:hypothetical protein
MIQLNHTYEFIIDNVAFGDLTKEQCYKLLKDGRLSSHFLEKQLEIWFPELTFVDGRGHDHIDESGQKYDQKCFTKGGLGFAPSKMGGVGRVFVQEEAHEHAKEIIYIACDITEFPNLLVRFERGSDLLVKYPRCQVPYKHRLEFFEINA